MPVPTTIPTTILQSTLPMPTSPLPPIPQLLEGCADVSELNRRMTNMPRQMRTFSLGLRSLFAENAVTGAKSADNFRR
jgi:hypothetical protein